MSGVPLWPMAQCLDGRHPPFNLEHYPTGCPFHHAARSTSEGLDVERLARALAVVGWLGADAKQQAEAVAREYAALGSEDE